MERGNLKEIISISVLIYSLSLCGTARRPGTNAGPIDVLPIKGSRGVIVEADKSSVNLTW